MTVDREFVGLPSPVVGRAGAGGHPCQGIYHTPGNQPNPNTAFIATHYNVDFSEHYVAEYMAARGFGFLGWNTRFRGNEAYFMLDHALAEIAVGVQWRRDRGVERIVLLDNSGGGSLMAAYHSQSREPSIRPARDRTVVPQAKRNTPGCYAGEPKRANVGVFGIGSLNTCRTWLNMWSLTDSDCGALPHLAKLDLPTLLVQPDADNGVFAAQAEEIFGGIASDDNEMVTLPGDHYFGEPAPARDQVADLVAEWINAR